MKIYNLNDPKIKKDKERLIKKIAEKLQEHYARYVNWSTKEWRALVNSRLKTQADGIPLTLVMVDESKGKNQFAGTISVERGCEELNIKEGAWITGLFVDYHFRHHGVSLVLLQNLLNYFLESNISSFSLYALNTPYLDSLYESLKINETGKSIVEGYPVILRSGHSQTVLEQVNNRLACSKSINPGLDVQIPLFSRSDALLTLNEMSKMKQYRKDIIKALTARNDIPADFYTNIQCIKEMQETIQNYLYLTNYHLHQKEFAEKKMNSPGCVGFFHNKSYVAKKLSKIKKEELIIKIIDEHRELSLQSETVRKLYDQEPRIKEFVFTFENNFIGRYVDKAKIIFSNSAEPLDVTNAVSYHKPDSIEVKRLKHIFYDRMNNIEMNETYLSI